MYVFYSIITRMVGLVRGSGATPLNTLDLPYYRFGLFTPIYYYSNLWPFDLINWMLLAGPIIHYLMFSGFLPPDLHIDDTGV